MCAAAQLLAGCRSQQQKSAKALDSARSSSAAAAFVGAAWSRGRLPDAFARDAFHLFSKVLTTTLKSPLPAEAAAAIRQARAAASTAGDAVSTDNRAAVAQSTAVLDAATHVLEQAVRQARQP